MLEASCSLDGGLHPNRRSASRTADSAQESGGERFRPPTPHPHSNRSKVTERRSGVEIFELLSRPLLNLAIQSFRKFTAEYGFRPLVLSPWRAAPCIAPLGAPTDIHVTDQNGKGWTIVVHSERLGTAQAAINATL